jgi:enamine deaminase RidA (YjgF/YER057c/UK114 family)
MQTSIEDRLKSLNLTLPMPLKAVGSYVPTIRVGFLMFTSGSLPFNANGTLQFTQQVDSTNLEEGREAVKMALLNALSQIKASLGSLDEVERIVKLSVFVNSQPGFCEQHLVANAASDLLVELWGEKGQHVRTAIGVSELPLGASVEIELIVQTKSI